MTLQKYHKIQGLKGAELGFLTMIEDKKGLAKEKSLK